jgi:hypothetical protein
MLMFHITRNNEQCKIIIYCSTVRNSPAMSCMRVHRARVDLLREDWNSFHGWNDRLCGLVVRVLGYKFGGQGSIPGTTRFSGKKEKKTVVSPLNCWYDSLMHKKPIPNSWLLYSQGWVDPTPDPLLLRKSGSTGNRIRTSGSIAGNSDR